MESKISQVQKYLAEFEIDGWLLYNFQHSNPLALQFLEISPKVHLSRRFFYYIPSKGSPVKIVHCIEENILDHLPGEKLIYLRHEQLFLHLKAILKESKKVAMEYSPENHIPYISKIDAGTKELIEQLGPKVVSSGDFLQYFTCVLTPLQKHLHKEAGRFLDELAHSAFEFIKEELIADRELKEYEVQKWLESKMDEAGFETEFSPIVAFAQNTSNPHYTPDAIHSRSLKKQDLILLDIVAKKKTLQSVYADITRVAIAGEKPLEKQEKVFCALFEAQKQTFLFIQERFASKNPVKGFEADRYCRDLIKKAGFSDFFIHRTGHNIYESVHGPGAHLDGLETLDERLLIPNTVFTIEPGIYFPGDFGLRVEYDVLIEENGKLEITSGVQEKIKCLFD